MHARTAASCVRAAEIALFHELCASTATVLATSERCRCCSVDRRTFKQIFQDGQTWATPVVLLTDPGQDFDDEMALVLAHALADMQLIELRAVIANLRPSGARAQLARGTLDALELFDVPVGVSSADVSTATLTSVLLDGH